MQRMAQSRFGVKLLIEISVLIILTNLFMILTVKWIGNEIDSAYPSKSDIKIEINIETILDSLHTKLGDMATQYTLVSLIILLVVTISAMFSAGKPPMETNDLIPADEEEDEEDLIEEDLIEEDLVNSGIGNVNFLMKSAAQTAVEPNHDLNPDMRSLEALAELSEDSGKDAGFDMEELPEMEDGDEELDEEYLIDSLQINAQIPDQGSGTLAHSYSKMVEALQKVAELEKDHSIELANANKRLYNEIQERKKAEAEIRHLSSRLISGIEEAKKELAQDLHDEFGQTLAALHMGMEGLWNSIPDELEGPKKKIDEIILLVEQLGDKIRNISSELRPDLLDDLGLVPTLDWYVTEFSEKRQDIHVEFQAIGMRKRLPAEKEVVFYRIFQESLNNVVKHSKAKNVSVTLTQSHPNVILTIKDDGVGFSPGEKSDGIGLLGMRERAVSVNGAIEIHSAKGKGTLIRVEIPVAQ